jgi:serine/threonine protein kinase
VIEAVQPKDLTSGDKHWGEGSPYWMAPEVIEGRKPTFACDIWSLGCTVYEMLTGSPPYADMPPMSALFKIVHDGPPPFPEDVSSLLEDFLLRCYRMDPSLRPSADQLISHPFFTGGSLEEVSLFTSNLKLIIFLV